MLRVRSARIGIRFLRPAIGAAVLGALLAPRPAAAEDTEDIGAKRPLGRLEQESVDDAMMNLGLLLDPAPQGKTIGRIHVVNQEVFSRRDWWFQWFNHFHRTTRPEMLRRDLLVKPGQLYDDRERVSDGAIRRLARKCEPALLYRVARADCLGRTGDFPPVAMEWFLERVETLHVAVRPPAPLLMGRHVLAMGIAPGPEVGRILQAVYERQLDGVVTNLEEAEAEARRMIN